MTAARFAKDNRRYPSDIDVEHRNGIDWFDTPRGYLDVAACLLGRHRVCTRGWISLTYIERCSCSATRIDRNIYHNARWEQADPFIRR